MSRPVAFILSLALNLMLAVVVLAAVKQRRTTVIAGPNPPPGRSENAVAPIPILPEESSPGVTNEVIAPCTWNMVESTDYRTYRDNLRAIGCPEQRIRDILIADIHALFAARARDYVAPLQGQFWGIAAKIQSFEATFKEHETALTKMESEREQIFQELFGESNPQNQLRNQRRQLTRNTANNSQLDFLDDAKRAGVLSLQSEREQALQAMRTATSSGPYEERQKQRAAKQGEIQKRYDAKIQALLTPEEFAEYQLRNSSSANVRSQLGRMTLAESEAHRLAQLLADKTEAAAALDGKDPGSKTARDLLEERTQAQIKEVLGEDRYREYQRVSDRRYGETARIIERLDLPEQTAVAIYQARVTAENLANRLRADASASAAERTAALATIRAEAENSVRTLLGAPAFQEYQNHAGSWFQGLAQPAK